MIGLLAVVSVAGCAATTTPPAASHGSVPPAVPAVRSEQAAPVPDFREAEAGYAAALSAFTAGDHDLALRTADAVRDRFPGTAWSNRALFLSLRSNLLIGRSDDAEAAARRIRSEFPALSDHALFLLAGHHASGGRHARAAELFREAAERAPTDVLRARARYRLAQAHADGQDHRQAAAGFEDFLAYHPQHELASEAAVGLARSRTLLMDDDGALRAYRDVYVRYPGEPRDAEAERFFARSRGAGSAVPDLDAADLYERGRNLFRLRQHDKAYAAFSSALLKDPAFPRRADALLKSGISLFHLGRRAEAVTILIRAVPESGPEALAWLGKSYSRLGEREKAVRTYLRIVSNHPDSEWADDALYLIGNVYRDANDRENALRYYGRLADEHPESSYADSGLWWNAWSWYVAGEYGKADRALQRLAAAYPRSFLAPQALYWRGRIAEKREVPTVAAARYRSVLKRNPYTYYGYLAAERLAALGSLAPPDPTETTETDAAESGIAAEQLPEIERDDGSLAREPAFQRVLELVRVDLRKEAAAELWDLQDRIPRKRALLIGMSRAFADLGDHHRSLLMVLRNYEPLLERPADDVPQDLWLLAYPQGYWTSIEAAARRNGLDPHFIAAVIRQESRFQSDAVSPAGARGVMQVMPSTGEWAARASRMEGFEPGQLFDSDRNIAIGTWYLGTLMRKYRGDLLLVAAAYNAGPAPVAGWTGKQGIRGERDEFVESIPYTETRWYVKKVLANYAEYRRLYGRHGRSLRLLTPVEQVIADAAQEDGADIP